MVVQNIEIDLDLANGAEKLLTSFDIQMSQQFLKSKISLTFSTCHCTSS